MEAIKKKERIRMLTEKEQQVTSLSSVGALESCTQAKKKFKSEGNNTQLIGVYPKGTNSSSLSSVVDSSEVEAIFSSSSSKSLLMTTSS